MAPRRKAFFSLPALLLVGGMVAMVLYLLFPRQAIFENREYVQNPDGLSIAYLEVLMRADAGNIPLRLNLAEMLKNSGQLERAAEVLAPGMEQEPVDFRIFESYLALTVLRLHAQPEGPAKEAIREELFASVQRLIEQPYPLDRILRIKQPSARWLTVPQRLVVLNALQPLMIEPRHQLQSARELARLQEAEGNPGAAAATLRPHLNLVEGRQRELFVDNLIRLELASGNPGAALSLFRQHRTRPPMTSDTLRQGVRLAKLAGASRDEQIWLAQWAELEPGNLPLQRELLGIQLGSGQLAAALVTARRLEAQPGSLTQQDRTRIAQVMEWNDRPAEALNLWRALYRDSNSSLAYERAYALSQELFQWEKLTELLLIRQQRQQLDPAGYDMLADALIRQGRFDQARQSLDQGMAQHPGSERLKERQLTLLMNLREFPAAITLLENRTTLSDRDRLILANLYWRTRQPEQALDTLVFEPADAALADEVYGMRLELATMLGRNDLLQQDYQRLVAMDDSRHNPQMLQRLRFMAVVFGDYPTALRLGQRQFATSGDERTLVDIAEYQLALQDWEGLESTLLQWDSEFPDARSWSRYWSLQALVYQRQGRPLEADAAYSRAFQLSPENEDIQISWAWSKLAGNGRFHDSLEPLLARIAVSPTENAYPVLAYGHSSLGNTRQSLYWFRQGLPSRLGDISWMIGYARLLEQTGAGGAASDLRQQTLAAMAEQSASPDQQLSLYREEQRQRQAWEVLGSFQRNGGAGDDGSDPDATREAMAYFALDQGHAQVAQALARQMDSGIAVAGEPPVQGGSADRGIGGDRQQRLDAALYPPPETRDQAILRYDRQLHQLDNELSEDERQSLTRSTVQLHQRFNRSLQVGTQWQNLGGFTVRRTGVTSQVSRNRYRWTLNADSLNTDGRGRLLDTPQTATDLTARIDRSGAEFDWSLALGQRPREQTRDTTASAETTWRGFDRVSLGAGVHYRERTPDSAEAWWITRRDRLSLSAFYTPFSRLNLSSRLDFLAVNSLDSTTLGEGLGIDLTGTYTLFRNDPAWTVAANYQRRRLSLARELPQSTNNLLAQPLATGELLTEEFERIGISTRWFHGEPHALYRTTPSPRVFLGLGVGYVVSTNNPDFGLEAGLGWRIVGDDELALSGRLSTEGLDGEGRADFNLTYTLYFGR